MVLGTLKGTCAVFGRYKERIPEVRARARGPMVSTIDSGFRVPIGKEAPEIRDQSFFLNVSIGVITLNPKT